MKRRYCLFLFILFFFYAATNIVVAQSAEKRLCKKLGLVYLDDSTAMMLDPFRNSEVLQLLDVPRFSRACHTHDSNCCAFKSFGRDTALMIAQMLGPYQMAWTDQNSDLVKEDKILQSIAKLYNKTYGLQGRRMKYVLPDSSDLALMLAKKKLKIAPGFSGEMTETGVLKYPSIKAGKAIKKTSAPFRLMLKWEKKGGMIGMIQ